MIFFGLRKAANPVSCVGVGAASVIRGAVNSRYKEKDPMSGAVYLYSPTSEGLRSTIERAHSRRSSGTVCGAVYNRSPLQNRVRQYLTA